MVKETRHRAREDTTVYTQDNDGKERGGSTAGANYRRWDRGSRTRQKIQGTDRHQNKTEIDKTWGKKLEDTTNF